MRAWAIAARKHAFAMRGAGPPPPLRAPPLAPRVTAANATHVSWAGAPLAANYSVALDGRVVCDRCATDRQTPLRIDGGVKAGESIVVTGYGVDGRAGPPSEVWQMRTGE